MESGEPNSHTNPFQCASCPKSYSRKSSLKDHIQRKHTDGECKSYSCKKCMDNKQLAKTFATKKHLTQHMARVHGSHRFKCQVCFKTFSNKSDFHRHQNIHNQSIEKRYKCDLCSTILSSKQSLQKHLFCSHRQKSEGFQYFPCKICPSEFSGRSHLERHILRKHVVDKECECKVCSKKFVDQEALEKHMSQHDRPIKYFCDICSKGFTATQKLIHHLGVVHKKFYYCNKCCRSYGHKSEFDHHSDLKISSEQKILAFNCPMCGESFDSQCNLDIHTNCHLAQIKCETSNDELLKKEAGTKPIRPSISMQDLTLEFQCELCSKSFDRETYFTAHRNQVHPNAEWTCSFQQCSKTFKMWSRLRRHKLTHLGTKPFACTLCRRTFYHPKQLKDHELNHLTDKKYKCKMCPNSFARPSQLRVHVANNHRGPKPFECPFKNCGTTWPNNCQLKLHLVSHATEKSFKCDVCTTIKSFKTLGTLKRHERQVHLESILIRGGTTIKDKINPKITKHSDSLVFICCSNKCSFETVKDKNVALHYNVKHGLPKVLIYQNKILPSLLEETPTFETKRLIQKRYKCRVCAAYLKLNSNFTQHQLTHSSETPFKCPQCLTRFKYQSSVNRHIRKVHKETDAKVTNSFELCPSKLSDPCHENN